METIKCQDTYFEKILYPICIKHVWRKLNSSFMKISKYYVVDSFLESQANGQMLHDFQR